MNLFNLFRFYELLEGVAQICERECNLLPPNVSPDCAIQLTYVAKVYHDIHNFFLGSKHLVQCKILIISEANLTMV